jgi:hypothetical protein
MSELEPNDERLERMARALAGAQDGRTDDAARTRARILQSRAEKQRRGTWIYAAAAILVLCFGVPTAWAWATGRLERWLAPEPPQREQTSATAPETTSRRRAPSTLPETIAPVVPPEAVTPVTPPEAVAPVTPPEPVRAPPSAEAVAPEPERLAAEPERNVDPAERIVDPAERRAYREAHALHFEARDPEGALAAWERYLARHPSGRFAIEARYNRALCLVRLDRQAEAREALVPFAEGRYGEYRRREAAALTEAMAP